MKAFRPALLSAVLGASTLIAAPAFAEENVSADIAARAVVCAQTLGFAQGTEEDRVVVAPRGAGNIRIEKVEGASPARTFSVGAFDIATCEAVLIPIWVQDDTGTTHPKGEGPVVTFSRPALTQGYYEIRSDRSIDRDLGFAIRNQAQ